MIAKGSRGACKWLAKPGNMCSFVSASNLNAGEASVKNPRHDRHVDLVSRFNEILAKTYTKLLMVKALSRPVSFLSLFFLLCEHSHASMCSPFSKTC